MNEKEDTNPYESSKGSVGIGDSHTMAPYFFTTSTLKLTLMSICTLSIYQLYWFYKNWALIKERTGQNIMPFWRASFAPFWAYSCFKHIKISAEDNNIQESLSIGLLAVVYIILPSIMETSQPTLVYFLS